MTVTYILAFCRVAVGLLFLASFLGKIRDLEAFRLAIVKFHLLPEQMSQATALLILGGELLIVLCLLVGGVLLLPGFVLAVILLCVFSSAIVHALVRKHRIACNCFGNSEKELSPINLYRNAGLLLCAAGGYSVQSGWQTGLQPLSWLQWLLVALGAAVFVLLWTQLEEVVQLFR